MLSVVLMVAVVPADEIDVKFVRPSKLLAQLRGLIANIPGVGVQADDKEGVLRVAGTPQNRSRVRQMVSLLDVRPGPTTAELRFYCPLERRGGEATLRLRNNDEWRLQDVGASLEISLRGRINETGSSTYWVRLKSEAGEVQVQATLEKRQTLVWDGKRYQVFSPEEYGRTTIPGVFAPDFYGQLPEGWRGGTLVAITQR